MNIKDLEKAQKTAAAVIAKYKAAPDPIDVRLKALNKLSKDELIARIVELEGAATKSFKVEDLAHDLLTAKECAILPYKVLAEMIRTAFPQLNTSEKSLASYASKRDDWATVQRKRFSL